MEKVLIVYYSRSGNTKKVAETLSARLGADLEEIKTEKSYAGVMGWILAGKEGSQKTSAKIKPTEKNPANYDLVIFGTPIWGWNIASPLRAYLEQNKDKFKKISAFCTMGGSYGKCFKDIEAICEKTLETTAAFIDKDISAGKIEIENFLIKK
jgi:flavodoxin